MSLNTHTERQRRVSPDHCGRIGDCQRPKTAHGWGRMAGRSKTQRNPSRKNNEAGLVFVEKRIRRQKCHWPGAARADRPSTPTSWLPDWSIRTRKVVRPECLRTSD